MEVPRETDSDDNSRIPTFFFVFFFTLDCSSPLFTLLLQINLRRAYLVDTRCRQCLQIWKHNVYTSLPNSLFQVPVTFSPASVLPAGLQVPPASSNYPLDSVPCHPTEANVAPGNRSIPGQPTTACGPFGPIPSVSMLLPRMHIGSGSWGALFFPRNCHAQGPIPLATADPTRLRFTIACFSQPLSFTTAIHKIGGQRQRRVRRMLLWRGKEGRSGLGGWWVEWGISGQAITSWWLVMGVLLGESQPIRYFCSFW